MDTDKHGLDKTKMKLRSEIRGVLKNVSSEKRAADSAKIRALLQQQPFWKTAAVILFFAPLSEEADVWPLLEEALATGKTVALPRFDPKGQNYVACRVHNLRREIVTGQFGIREPGLGCGEIPSNSLDLILVPGVVFDLAGHRLGRGKGFYDRLLAGVRGIKCGAAFDEQIVEAIPVDPLDIRMDWVLTPTRCVEA